MVMMIIILTMTVQVVDDPDDYADPDDYYERDDDDAAPAQR